MSGRSSHPWSAIVTMGWDGRWLWTWLRKSLLAGTHDQLWQACYDSGPRHACLHQTLLRLSALSRLVVGAAKACDVKLKLCREPEAHRRQRRGSAPLTRCLDRRLAAVRSCPFTCNTSCRAPTACTPTAPSFGSATGAKMINAVLVFNNNGQPRLTKFYTQLVHTSPSLANHTES